MRQIMSVRVAVFAVLVLCGFTGCGPAKLKQSKSFTLDAGLAQSIDLDAQKKPQKITIEYSSSAEDVYVYVYKEADAQGEEGLLNANINKAKALATKQGKGETFTVDVPENTAIRVIFRASKTTNVTVKLTNS